LGGATVIGPLLVGLRAAIQIVPLSANVSDIVTMATMAAYDVNQPVKRQAPY
jgi:malate dehydrogenase (oxaloacetate-decarboxylating)(NADP+)